MAARILDLADAAVALVRARWQPASPDAVSRAYAPEIPLVGAEGQTLLTGRQVYVFPGGYAAPELVTRNGMDKRYVLGVLIVERYTGTGQPPDEWVDERVSWVESEVFRPLRYPPVELLKDGGDGVIPDPEDGGTVDVLYDQDLLQQRQAFWSALTLRYTELEALE